MLKESIRASKLYDSIICVGGGFSQGHLKDADVFEKYDEMDRKNFKSALLAAHFATHQLNNKGFVAFTGAAAAFNGPVEHAVTYGISKCATHSLAMTLALRSEIPADSCVVTLLPSILDTEANRKAMPDADMKEWIDPKKLAETVFHWAAGVHRPLNGSFISISYKNNTIVPNFM